MGRCYSHNQGVTGDLEKRIQVLEIKIRGLENSNEELQRYKVGLGNIATDHNLQLIESYRIISELRDEISRLQSRVKALEQKITAEKGKK